MSGFQVLVFCAVVCYTSAFPTILPSCDIRENQRIQKINNLQTEIEGLQIDLNLDLETMAVANLGFNSNAADLQQQMVTALSQLFAYFTTLRHNLHVSSSGDNIVGERAAVRAKGVTDPDLVEIFALMRIFDRQVTVVHETIGSLCLMMRKMSAQQMNAVGSAMSSMDETLGMTTMQNMINNMVSEEDVMRFIDMAPCYQRAVGYLTLLRRIAKTDPKLLVIAYNVKAVISTCNIVASTASELRNAVPYSIRNAVFLDKVCIKNVAYNEYLLVDKYRHSGNNRLAFTWIEKNIISEASWLFSQRAGNQVTVYNKYHKDYLTESGGRVISSESVGSWILEPEGDDVFIKNVANGQYMYVDNSIFCSRRRHVRTHSSRDTNSRWFIVPC